MGAPRFAECGAVNILMWSGPDTLCEWLSKSTWINETNKSLHVMAIFSLVYADEDLKYAFPTML